jgi:hypothetical protein
MIEELAKTFDGTLSPIVSEDELKVAEFLRSLSTTLKDLEEKTEALEWLIKNGWIDNILERQRNARWHHHQVFVLHAIRWRHPCAAYVSGLSGIFM